MEYWRIEELESWNIGLLKIEILKYWNTEKLNHLFLIQNYVNSISLRMHGLTYENKYRVWLIKSKLSQVKLWLMDDILWAK